MATDVEQLMADVSAWESVLAEPEPDDVHRAYVEWQI